MNMLKNMFGFLILFTFILKVQSFYEGQMIDAHGHIAGAFDDELIVRLMDENSISKQIVMARYYGNPNGDDPPGNDFDAIRVSEKYPNRFLPLIGMQRKILTGAKKWDEFDYKIIELIDEVEDKIKTNKYYGIGEFIVRHWAYSKGRHAEQDNPIYSKFMKKMSSLASKYEIAMVIHMEGYPNLVSDLSRLISEYPRARFVWAHNCGRSKANIISEMLSKYDNLYCDLGNMANVGNAGYGIGWPRMEKFTALIEEDGVLDNDMKNLFERFSDRFTIGMDVAHSKGLNLKNYSRRSNRFRELLSQLKNETAEKIAFQNALKIFTLPKI